MKHFLPHYLEPRPVRSHMFGLTGEDTQTLMQIYRRVGRSSFTWKDIEDIPGVYRQLSKTYNSWGMLKSLGYNGRGKVWKISDVICARLDYSTDIVFEPFKRTEPPLVRYKMSKYKLTEIGMTLDGKWHLCSVSRDSKFTEVCVRTEEFANKKFKMVRIHQMDYDMCQAWLDQRVIEQKQERKRLAEKKAKEDETARNPRGRPIGAGKTGRRIRRWSRCKLHGCIKSHHDYTPSNLVPCTCEAE